jgi:hypothetical protein
VEKPEAVLMPKSPPFSNRGRLMRRYPRRCRHHASMAGVLGALLPMLLQGGGGLSGLLGGALNRGMAWLWREQDALVS